MNRYLLAPSLALLSLACAPAHAQQLVQPCAGGINANSAGSCAALIQPQATASAVEGSHVLKAFGPATMVDANVTNASASPIWVFVFDAATAPTGAGAAITGCTNAAAARPCVAKTFYVPANTTINPSWIPGPFPQLQTGIVIACSSTGPFTLTYSVNCAISGEAM